MESSRRSNVLRRKPVPVTVPGDSSATEMAVRQSQFQEAEEEALVQATRNLQLDTAGPSSSEVYPGDNDLKLVQSPSSLSASTLTTPISRTNSDGSVLKSVSHFAGGLIHHPYEATKHYSILRHSHGLVYYKGSSTNVAISIFSDAPLPPGRTLWMQRKGYSGNLGMNAKAFFKTNSSWINVTPAERIDVTELPPTDERAWQRDIKKLLRKAPKALRKHEPRETDVLRIPASALDGYFRIVLCADEESKKVLCPSPVFRVASTSTSMGHVKGASLSTLPMELGIKVGTMVGKNMAGTFVKPLVSPVTSQISSQMSRYQPGLLVQEAASTAYTASGMQDRIVGVNDEYNQKREIMYEPMGPESLVQNDSPIMIGLEEGPESPFPIRFDGKVVRGTGMSTEELAMPTANLSGVGDDNLLRLNGIYFGWACVIPMKGTDVNGDWLESIISVGPSAYAAPTVKVKKEAHVHLIYDFEGAEFFNSKVKVIIMGFLRPMQRAPDGMTPQQIQEKVLFEKMKDISIAEASLERPAWGPEETLQRIKTASSNRSFSERYVDARKYGQKQVDKVPAHRIGVRMPGAVHRDRAFGNGGLWVAR